MKYYIFLLALLSCTAMWGNDGDTFVAKSNEGVDITFMVVSEAEKTCKVGVGDLNIAAIDKNQEGVLTIPESANGYTVVAVSRGALSGTKMSAFYLPNTIKTIEEWSFDYNYNLKDIDIPESVETIEEGAFAYCRGIVHVSFHEGLKTIGELAFNDNLLTSINLPSSLEFISPKSFTNIPHLASVTVRSSKPISYDRWKHFFDDETFMRATLYVPEGTTSSFKADDEWGRFRIIKEGEPLFEHPTDIAYPEDFGRQYVVHGNPVAFNINFINERTTPVSSISYIPIIDGIEGEEQTYEFPQPIAANGKPFTLSFSLPDFDEPKEVDVILDIIKMNGIPVNYGADILPNTRGTACVYIPVLDHKVLIEDYTSTTCIWALRSNIGFEKLKEKYGDKIIRASKHVGDIMWCDPFSYTPVTPACQINGINGWCDEKGDYHHYDPYYGEGSEPLGILDLIEKKMATPHFGKVKILSAQWADAEQTEIKIVTESTINMSHYSKEKRLFLIIYTLVEDGMKGEGPDWEQLNGYAGMTTDDPYLQSITHLPYTISDMAYPDVAVGYYDNPLWGESFLFGVPQVQTYTLRLSEKTQSLCQDKNKLSIVACLQDQDEYTRMFYEGDFIDADNSPITSYSSGVQSIMKDAVPNDVYDLSGRKVKSAAFTLDGLPKGVYIYRGKKKVISNK
ncbi:MAG: leucine-rich repeat domain-containing protein [Prevotella sp.]|nr:leucine-rich repeat domain-containing protein [Prevotella sp.]